MSKLRKKEFYWVPPLESFRYDQPLHCQVEIDNLKFQRKHLWSCFGIGKYFLPTNCNCFTWNKNCRTLRGNMENQKSDILRRKYSGWVAGDFCLGCCPKDVLWATSHRVIAHLQGQKSPIDHTTISTVAITDKDDI